MGEDDEQPPPQPEPLRQQQRSVALGGSILAGLAVMIGFIQRFPDVALAGVLAGVVSGVVVYRLAVASVFPGEESTTPEAAKDDGVTTPNSEGDEAAMTDSGGDDESATSNNPNNRER